VKQMARLGSANGSARLTEQQVRRIRRDRRKQGEIARCYKVSREAINAILCRRNWAWLTARGVM
jgi:transcriptional regulator